MRIAGFLALHREKIGTKLYGYILAKRYTRPLFTCPERLFIPSKRRFVPNPLCKPNNAVTVGPEGPMLAACFLALCVVIARAADWNLLLAEAGLPRN